MKTKAELMEMIEERFDGKIEIDEYIEPNGIRSVRVVNVVAPEGTIFKRRGTRFYDYVVIVGRESFLYNWIYQDLCKESLVDA